MDYHGGVEFRSPVSVDRYNILKFLVESSNISKVLDIGCCDASCLIHLSHCDSLSEYIGFDINQQSIEKAIEDTGYIVDLLPVRHSSASASFIVGNAFNPPQDYFNFDGIVSCIEVIEHLELVDTLKVFDVILGDYHPPIALITTPNQEFNIWFDSPQGQMRHWDHKFEWTRKEFEEYSKQAAEFHGYDVIFVHAGFLSYRNILSDFAQKKMTDFACRNSIDDEYISNAMHFGFHDIPEVTNCSNQGSIPDGFKYKLSAFTDDEKQVFNKFGGCNQCAIFFKKQIGSVHTALKVQNNKKRLFEGLAATAKSLRNIEIEPYFNQGNYQTDIHPEFVVNDLLKGSKRIFHLPWKDENWGKSRVFRELDRWMSQGGAWGIIDAKETWESCKGVRFLALNNSLTFKSWLEGSGKRWCWQVVSSKAQEDAVIKLRTRWKVKNDELTPVDVLGCLDNEIVEGIRPETTSCVGSCLEGLKLLIGLSEEEEEEQSSNEVSDNNSSSWGAGGEEWDDGNKSSSNW